ncbi:hypothetical protein X766_15920 [Mesorhizobium sp. LSJC255A00]|uniref:hypothetical protein n=1 Tax=Mesorhizobium sp. LSJC255A00 TaxID=1287313 RepID=UPI0003CE196B|nr:hypothetical protein [Mesorhizobium sp. LSJC255A00]ESX17882.1 hypothetical protein X766_15920 [Mesorhizobium sp. LSJC255A00]
MKIVDLFRQLSFGELSNLAISNSGSGAIVEEKQPQLIHYANDALLALYSRFLLSEKDLVIEMANQITNYHLIRKYTETSGSDVDWPYIKDLPDEPYEEDLIKILEVWDASGCQLPLNDKEDPRSLFTPYPNILQVPAPVGGLELAVVYQASHRKLDDRLNATSPLLDQNIELPIYLENPLRLFVAYKVFSHMNGQENIVKSQEYLGAYEAACLDIEQRDLVNQTFSTSHHKLEDRGFA